MRSLTFVSPLSRFRQVQKLFKQDIQKYSTNLSESATKTREFEEIQFNVPWGHIAGKWYGPKDKRPIVGLHGWQDNCGTFDTLAPLLPEDIGFLSIDLPGHGLSSWLPKGCNYHSLDYNQILFLLMREFKWDKISMVCHSMSAVNGFIYNSLFPEKCDMFISLDIIQPILRTKERTIKSLTEQFELQNKQMEYALQDSKLPSYDYDQLLERMYKGSSMSVSKECCKFILDRNIKPSTDEPNKFVFRRDGRLKSMMFYLIPRNVVLEMAARIKCPHLYIKAHIGSNYEMKPENEEVLGILKQNPAFEHYLVNGTHHVHLNEPQKVADFVNPFIYKHRLA